MGAAALGLPLAGRLTRVTRFRYRAHRRAEESLVMHPSRRAHGLPRLAPPRLALSCFALSCLALAACSSSQLPVGATLDISPPARSIDIVERRDAEDRCLFDPADHVDLPVVLALRDGQGSPIGGAELTVYVDFAANTYGGFPVLALYDDLNGNGVVDAGTELVSGADDGAVRVTTSRFAGERTLLVRANLSCPYRAEMFAFVDGVSATATFEVSSGRVVGPAPDETAFAPRAGASS